MVSFPIGLLLLLALLAGYVLSVGPVDYLVEREYVPGIVLYYQRPLYFMAHYCPAFDRFLDWYVSDLWTVDQPSLRGAR